MEIKTLILIKSKAAHTKSRSDAISQSSQKLMGFSELNQKLREAEVERTEVRERVGKGEGESPPPIEINRWTDRVN